MEQNWSCSSRMSIYKVSGHHFFKRFYLFLEREEGKEKERERNISVWLPLSHTLLGTWPATQACGLTGNWTSNPLVCKLALNPLSHTSQGSVYILDTMVRSSSFLTWIQQQASQLDSSTSIQPPPICLPSAAWGLKHRSLKTQICSYHYLLKIPYWLSITYR